MKSRIACFAASTALGVFSLGSASVALADETKEAAAEVATKKDKEEKITDRNHPDYVKCRSERVMGSLAQRKRTCMTNREWKMVQTEGNKRANDFVDDMRATSLPN